jgi:energy-coupling factor transport system substrate-specific component
MFASALLTGGVGPWLPFQMLAASWVSAGAGLLPGVRGRAEVWLLAAYGAVAGLAYGLLLNLSFWPFAVGQGTGLSFVAGAPMVENLRRFVAFSLATSLGFDVPRAVLTALLVLVTGRHVLLALRRASRRAAFDAPVRFDGADRLVERAGPAEPGPVGEPGRVVEPVQPGSAVSTTQRRTSS